MTYVVTYPFPLGDYEEAKGQMVGYGGGVDRKVALLDLERTEKQRFDFVINYAIKRRMIL